MSASHPSLAGPPAVLIGGEWRAVAGDGLTSVNPAHPSRVVWQGSPVVAHVGEAAGAARRALPEWSAWAPERRYAVLHRFAALCRETADAIGSLICDETGKALWDATAEAGALAAKVAITVGEPGDSDSPPGLSRVAGYELSLADTRTGRCYFRPHGVMAIVGPFNFPAHLPNGHTIPALAMGNTTVFKPSDKTPGVGQMLGELLQTALDEAGAPAGVLNVIQGGADVASRLTTHPAIDGVLFTGSWPVGRRILEANLDNPGRIVALELGGNNPAVVMDDADIRQAAIEVARCAFITTGQRCTCTRRLIVHETVADRLIGAVCKAASQLIIADPRAEHPVFMGPLINEQARDAVLASQAAMVKAGARVMLEGVPVDLEPGAGYISPSVLRVDRFSATDDEPLHDAGCDREVFGPLLRVAVVSNLDEAIEQANATRYGLAASIFTKDQRAVERFLREARAGCVNVNTGTAGASSKLPFGGLGLSGNHRPAGAFGLDYCAYPVGAMIESGSAAAIPPGMRFDDDWL